MHLQLVKAQIETLREWALDWEREGTPGTTEVGFLLRRAATQAEKAIGIDTVPDVEPAPEVTDIDPGAEPRDEEGTLRHG